MRVLVVDDEPLARARVVRMLAAFDDVEVVGEAEDGVAAQAAIARCAPDVLLLDIEMPRLDGLELAERAHVPIVFTTAYAEHAWRAFEVAAVDYLLKPISHDGLARALDRVRQLARPGTVRLVARCGSTLRIVPADEVLRLTARDKYTTFVVDGEELILDESLVELEKRLAPLGFLRVHRAELVAVDRAVALHTGDRVELELEDGSRVPVSRRLAPAVRRRLAVRGE